MGLGLFGNIPVVRADLACNPNNCPDGVTFGATMWGCMKCPFSEVFCCDYKDYEWAATCRLYNSGNNCALNGGNGIVVGGCTDYEEKDNDECTGTKTNHEIIGCCPQDPGGGGGGGGGGCTPGTVQPMMSCSSATGGSATGIWARYYYWDSGTGGCTPGAPGGYFCHLWGQDNFSTFGGTGFIDGNVEGKWPGAPNSCTGIMGITWDGYIYKSRADYPWHVWIKTSNGTDQRDLAYGRVTINGVPVADNNFNQTGEHEYWTPNWGVGWYPIHLEVARDGIIQLQMRFGYSDYGVPSPLWIFPWIETRPCPLPNASCSVSLSANSINVGQNVTSTLTGNAQTSGASMVRTIIVGRNGSLPIAPVPAGYTENYYAGGTLYNYTNAAANCTSTNFTQCSVSNTTSFATAGEYYYFCDSGSSVPKCSGNVFCPYQSSVVPVPLKSMNCDGWQSCGANDWKYLRVNTPTPSPSNTPTPTPTTIPAQVTIQGHIVDCNSGLDSNLPAGVGVSISGPVSQSYSGGSFWSFSSIPVGNYTVIANPVASYAVTYATCGVNCNTGPIPAGPWILGNTVNVSLPVNSNWADIYFKYCAIPVPPAEVTIMGWHKDPAGNNFSGGPVTISGPVTQSNVSNPFDFTHIPAGTYSVATSYPANYSVRYRACINGNAPSCVSPMTGNTSSLSVGLPNNGDWADVYFTYISPTPTPPAPTITSSPTPSPTVTPSPTPTPVVMIQGKHVNPLVTPFIAPGQNVAISGPVNRSSPASSSWFFNPLPGGQYGVAASSIANYSLSYAWCKNSSLPSCIPAPTYAPGGNLTVNLLNSGDWADVYFKYTPICAVLPTPANLTVAVQCQQNVLTWTDITGESGYTIQRSANGGATWANLTTTFQGVQTYTDIFTTGTCNQDYFYRIKAVNTPLCTPAFDSLYTAGVGPREYQCPPRASGNINLCQDTGGEAVFTWPNTTDGQRFDIYRGGVLINSIGPGETSYIDFSCMGLVGYEIRAVDVSKSLIPAPGCRTSSGSGLCGCSINTDSWWAASGGGNLVAAAGRIQSKLPPSTYLMHNAEGDFPGIAIANSWAGSAVTSSNVNSQHWRYTIAPPGWGDAGNRFLSERENLYLGMWDRIKPRVEPLNASATNLVGPGIFGVLLSSSGGHKLNIDAGVDVAVMHWTGNLTIDVGGLDVGANKVLLLVDGNVTINGPITWSDSAGGFMAILAQGNITIDPAVGQTGSANVIDIRSPAVPADLKGIYYAQGVVSTGHGVGEDKLLKVEGTVVGMGGVNLERVNKGVNPVEFFQFRPDLSEFLGRIGLRRRVINQLLNP